jgi:hypothetical protein
MGAESAYDKKGRGGVFLMVLLESSTFCKAVEKSGFGRNSPSWLVGRLSIIYFINNKGCVNFG